MLSVVNLLIDGNDLTRRCKSEEEGEMEEFNNLPSIPSIPWEWFKTISHLTGFCVTIFKIKEGM